MGRGNSRLMSWDGEKTLTFTMEDALISVDSLALLAAAKGKHYNNDKGRVHTQKRLGVGASNKDNPNESYVSINTTDGAIILNEKDALKNVAPATEDDDGKNVGLVYVLAADEGGFNSEPFLYKVEAKYTKLTEAPKDWSTGYANYFEKKTDGSNEYQAVVGVSDGGSGTKAPDFVTDKYYSKIEGAKLTKCTKDFYNKATDDYSIVTDEGKDGLNKLTNATAIYLDYYTTGHGFTRLTIEPDSFGSNFYIEADTLFRDKNGADYAAIFTIPNCRVQSNFTITMASSGDPSSFQFTIDAFPGYTRFDPTKEVLAAIDIMDEVDGIDTSRNYRLKTYEDAE